LKQCERGVEAEQPEGLRIIQANTVAYEWTMVIHFQNALVAA
jgi:hypothetical protein